MSDLLQRIQQMQFTQRGRAEALLRDFIRETFPQLHINAVQLRPQAVSLNSFNGFLSLENGEQLFFKTHTEQDNVIDEYYNARLLASAGYPVIQPLYSSTQAGQHLLIYEVIEDPSVFDLAWSIEQAGEIEQMSSLIEAQTAADKHLAQIYKDTLKLEETVNHAKAPIHQLFIHRLVGGRFDRFYGEGQKIKVPDQVWAAQSLFAEKRWVINGQRYELTLEEIVQKAVKLLDIETTDEAAIPTVVGHGDAHNGNVFFRQSDGTPYLLYFDPAFAGRHHPLLDIVKPLFHNVFAMWMYFPAVKAQQLTITCREDHDTWVVAYDYALHPIREAFLNSKTEYVLKPVVKELAERGWLRDNWRSYLKAALMCCPLLTLNLADTQRFPPEITLLGLAMTVEMGAESLDQHSRIDTILDDVVASIQSGKLN